MERNKFAGKIPAPIFSKKPRQALFAHPNNSNSANDHSGSYPGRTAYHKYGSSNTSKSATSSANYNRQSQGMEQSQVFNFNIDKAQSNRMMSLHDMEQYPNKSMDCNFLRSTTMLEVPRPSHFTPLQANVYSSDSKNKLSSNNMNNGKTFSDRQNGINQNRLIQSLQQSSQRLSAQYGTNSYTYNQQSYPQQTNASGVQHQQPYNNFQPPEFGQPFEVSPARGSRPYGEAVVPEANFGWNHGSVGNNKNLETNPPFETQGTKQILQETSGKNEFKIKKKETENSLRIVTTSITGIKQWLGHTNKITVIFEIFGNMNSAVTHGRNPVAREFLLKDDKEVLKCTFHQIDRDLPKLARGQWYRCTGKWCNNEGSLLCLSTRQATEDERKVYRLRINASDRALRAWKLKNSEF